MNRNVHVLLTLLCLGMYCAMWLHALVFVYVSLQHIRHIKAWMARYTQYPIQLSEDARTWENTDITYHQLQLMYIVIKILYHQLECFDTETDKDRNRYRIDIDEEDANTDAHRYYITKYTLRCRHWILIHTTIKMTLLGNFASYRCDCCNSHHSHMLPNNAIIRGV